MLLTRATVKGLVAPLIERTLLVCREVLTAGDARNYEIQTIKDDQVELELSIFQGEAEQTDENEYLGTVKLAPLPKGPRGAVSLTVEFALSAECLLTITAREVTQNLEVKTVFSTRDTPEVVKARLERNARIAAAVKAAQQKLQKPAAPAVKPRSWWQRLVGLFG